MKRIYTGSDYFTEQCKLLASVCRHGHSELYFVVRYAKLFSIHHREV